MNIHFVWFQFDGCHWFDCFMDHHNLLFRYIQRWIFFQLVFIIRLVDVIYLDLKFIQLFMLIDRLMFKNIHFNHSLVSSSCFLFFFQIKIWLWLPEYKSSYALICAQDQQTFNRLINLFIEMWWKLQPTEPIFMKR